MDRLWTPWRHAYVTGADSEQGSLRRKGVPAALAAWPGDRHCVFCNLIAAADYAAAQGMPREDADRAANIVLRGRHTYLCLNAYPYTSGHVMIVPYAHQSSLAQLDADAAHEMMDMARRAETALRKAYSPGGLNLGMNLGQSAGAGIEEHLHLHILPRWTGDTNFMTVVSETRVLPETLEDTWLRLRAALSDG